MHLLSVVLGLFIAWVILFFIGPKKRIVSYYVQAPVKGMPIAEIDSAMEAVGLASSGLKGQAEGPSPAPAPRPEALPSVAQVALNQSYPSPAPAPMMAPAPSPAGQGMSPTPQAFSPAPAPSPVLQ